MTRNKKIVIPNITYTNKSSQSGMSSALTAKALNSLMAMASKKTNLEVAKKALARLNNPKLSNLEKAKKALKESNNPLYYPFFPNKNFYQDLQFKVEVNQEKDLIKAKLLEELIKHVMAGELLPQNYDKNTNRNKSASS